MRTQFAITSTEPCSRWRNGWPVAGHISCRAGALAPSQTQRDPSGTPGNAYAAGDTRARARRCQTSSSLSRTMSSCASAGGVTTQPRHSSSGSCFRPTANSRLSPRQYNTACRISLCRSSGDCRSALPSTPELSSCRRPGSLRRTLSRRITLPSTGRRCLGCSGTISPRRGARIYVSLPARTFRRWNRISFRRLCLRRPVATSQKPERSFKQVPRHQPRPIGGGISGAALLASRRTNHGTQHLGSEDGTLLEGFEPPWARMPRLWSNPQRYGTPFSLASTPSPSREWMRSSPGPQAVNRCERFKVLGLTDLAWPAIFIRCCLAHPRTHVMPSCTLALSSGQVH